MNRYSQSEISAYNPMTAQEIWAPAAAMRQQHNEADKQIQTQIAELDKVDPLSVHYDKAQKIKSDLLKTINAQAEILATQGFNGNTTAGVYKTNRDLQTQFSPTGELGQINLAKKTYDIEKANYLEDATKNSKIGREQALKNWEKYSKTKYTGYSEDGKKISNIDALGTPAFQDYETDRNQYHALLGEVTSSAKASGHGIVTDPKTGLMMMVNRGGSVVHSDNIDNLNLAIKGMKDKWVSPTGEGRKWADAAGWDPVHTNYRIDQDFRAMKKISNIDNRTESYDVLSGQTPGGDKSSNSTIIQADDTTTPNKLASSSLGQISDRINQLKSIGSPTKEQQLELKQSYAFTKKVKESLNSNEKYKQVVKSENNLLNSIPFGQNTKNKLKNFTADNINFQVSRGQIYIVGGGQQIPISKDEYQQAVKYKNKLDSIQLMKHKLTKEAVSNNSLTYSGFQLIAGDSKEATTLKLMNDSFDNAVRANPNELLNKLNIESVNLDSGRKTNLSLEDKENIQKVVNRTDIGSMRIVSIIPHGSTGKPEYVIEVTTKPGQKAGRYGDGVPIRFNASFKKTAGSTLQNINGYIKDFISTKGQVDPNTGMNVGKDLANEIDLRTSQSQYGDYKWSDVVSKDTDFSKMDPIIARQLLSELKTMYTKFDSSSEKVKERMLNNFIRFKGNNNILFD